MDAGIKLYTIDTLGTQARFNSYEHTLLNAKHWSIRRRKLFLDPVFMRVSCLFLTLSS